MKNYLFALMALTGLAASAQDHYVRSFIVPQVSSLIVSNKTYGITNLNSKLTLGGVGAGTNTWGTAWTNTSGTFVYVTNNAAITNTSATFESYNILQDAPLWTDKLAQPLNMSQAPGGSSNAFGSILIRVVGATGKTSTLNFIFVPVPDGTNEVTAAANQFTVGVACNDVTPVVITTNLPSSFMIGARKLRLRTITNVDTSGSANAIVTHCALVGFSP